MLFTLYWLPPQATQSLCFINFRPDFSRLAISFHSHTNHPQNRCPLFLMHLAATPSTRYGNVWNKYLYKFSFYCNELYFTVLCRRLSCLDQQQLKISLVGFASFCFPLFFIFAMAQVLPQRIRLKNFYATEPESCLLPGWRPVPGTNGKIIL